MVERGRVKELRGLFTGGIVDIFSIPPHISILSISPCYTPTEYFVLKNILD